MLYGCLVRVREDHAGSTSIGIGVKLVEKRYVNIGISFIVFGTRLKRLQNMPLQSMLVFSSSGPVDALIGGSHVS